MSERGLILIVDDDAAGDVRHDVVRRVASAVGQGAASVHFVHKYLETV